MRLSLCCDVLYLFEPAFELPAVVSLNSNQMEPGVELNKVNLSPSSETQGQIVGTRESLNGRKNVARRKVKNGETSPWRQCLTFVFSGTNQKPERQRPFETGLVRHYPQGLFSPFFTFLRSIYIFSPV